jgi:retron-type reverse transcriptase
MTFAIEADIQGAFDNVDFEILIKILQKKIKDIKFLKLISLEMFEMRYFLFRTI